MQIDIQARRFSLTDALRSHAERRLRFALTCCDDHIQRVVMRLSDINGPHGGADKRCHLQVVLAGLSDVVVEDTEADLYIGYTGQLHLQVAAFVRSTTRAVDVGKLHNNLLNVFVTAGQSETQPPFGMAAQGIG